MTPPDKCDNHNGKERKREREAARGAPHRLDYSEFYVHSARQGGLDLSSWKSWELSPDASALDSPILARRDAHLNTRSGAADRSQRWRRSAEIDRDGRSRRICGAGGRKWGIWRWVVTPSWSMRARGAPPDQPRGPVRREQWIKTICFVRTRHTFSKICCGNALRAPLIRTRFLR